MSDFFLGNTFNLEFEVTNKRCFQKQDKFKKKNAIRKHSACDPMHIMCISLLKTWRKKSYLLWLKDSNRDGNVD